MGFASPPSAPIPHGATDHNNVTRELFIPALHDEDVDTTLTRHSFYSVIACADGAASPVYFVFKVPDDFVSFTSLKAVWICTAAGGNMAWSLHIDWAAAGEAYKTHTESTSAGVTATGGANIINAQESPTAAVLSGLASGDYVGANFYRDGAHADDTLGQDVFLLGLLFTYTAEQ